MMSVKAGKAIIEEGGTPVDVFVQCPLGPFVCDMQPKEVLTEFKKLYEGRIKRIERESGGNPELKINALEEWVEELMKQNAMLIDVASELERETCDRVALLESRLKCSARAARESMLQLQDFEEKTWKASAEIVKAQTNSLKTKSDLVLSEQEQVKLKKQVAGLRCDVSSLLQLVEKGVKTGKWSVYDLTFNEISQDELQSAFKVIERESQDKRDCEEPDDNYGTSEFSKLNSALEQEIIEKDSIIARLEAEVTHLSQELSLCESANTIGKLGAYLSESNENTRYQIQMQLEKSKEESDKKGFMISTLKEELSGMKKMISDLKRHITELEKASKETRDVLTNEVAEKHDQMLVLRGEVEKLEDALHKACMQTRFKDDIIKEMRQEIRISRAKVASLESEIQNRTLECSNARFQLSQNANYSCAPGERDHSSYSSGMHNT